MDAATLDLLPSVDALQDHLAAHDRAVRQIIMLDEYIERLSEQSVAATLDGQMSPSFRSMIRISVAEGLKRMYKEYRLHKWLKVQEMAATVRRVLAFAGYNNNDIQPSRVLAWGSAPAPEQLPLQQQPFPTAVPLLSPIITPQRSTQVMQGTIPSYQSARVLSPAAQVVSQVQGPVYSTVMNSEQLFSPQRQLIFEEGCLTEELTECATEDVSDDSAMDNSFVDDDMTSQILQDPMHTGPQQLHYGPQQLPQNYTSQSTLAPAGVTAFDNSSTSQQPHPQIGTLDNTELYGTDEEMDWDEDDNDDSFDENLAGVLFAAEQLLPEQQAVRLDVEMGDAGIGHLLFDRVNATWYTHHCEFHRGH